MAGALGWSAWARAEGEPCLRDSECGGLELCFEGACATSKQSAATCAKGDTTSCGPWDVCVDEVCKRDDPVCRNAVGVCFFGEGQGECVCANSPGIEWEGDPPDVGSPSEDPTGQCFDVLAATCPAEIPEPVCDTDEHRAACEVFVAQENALNEVCNGYVNDDPERIVGAIEFCCGEFDGVAAYRDCVVGLQPDDCAGFETCADGGPPEEGTTSGGSSPPDEAPPDEEPASTEATPDEEPIGCRVGGTGEGWLALLLLGVAGLRRRQAGSGSSRNHAIASPSSRKTA